MNNNFQYVPFHYAARTHEKMQEVLLHPDEKGPSIHYYMIRGGKDQRNITVWEPGLVGNEYIKTYGHYHIGDLDETYWVLYGEGIALEQKRAVDASGKELNDVIESFKVHHVKLGDELYFAPGHAHLVVNIGQTFLVTADDSPVYFDDPDPAGLPGHADYEPIKNLRGFAYYVIDHNGSPALYRNSNYQEIKHEELSGLKVIE